jgi:hypothetical protein
MRAWAASQLALLVHLASAQPAHADVQRFAIVVGNNEGDAVDGQLRYAESDATRVYEVLRDLGGFAPANMLLLEGEDARTLEETIIAVNERVRLALSHSGSQVMLFVYYSGHADADSLHLKGTRLPLRLFSQLIYGSAATFRLMVLDACHSGALTRAKGGHIVEPFPLLTEDVLPGNGLAVLAANAAHEDAQESEDIRGSFFTHAFVSGLMGAADQDGDGAVSLSEVYQYAYGATLRNTSGTLYGTQHPTFRFDFAGQGAVVLTRPESFTRARGTLHFPSGINFLVLREGADGAVVGEVSPYDRRRSLSVRPGGYFIRGRGRDVIFEGHVALSAGTVVHVDPSSMERIEYARLVRKGAESDGMVHTLATGPWFRTPLSNADSGCVGGFLAYTADLEHLGVRARGGMCTSRFSNRRVQATTNEYDLDLRLGHTWDVASFAFDLGLGAGAALFTQRFETRGHGTPRDSLSPYLLIGAGASHVLRAGYALGVDISGETHLLRMQSDDGVHSELALRVTAALAKAF